MIFLIEFTMLTFATLSYSRMEVSLSVQSTKIMKVVIDMGELH